VPAKDDVDAFPLRAFRLLQVEGEPTVRVLQLSSGREGHGPTWNLLVTREHLQTMAKEFQDQSRKMPPPVRRQ
jgi:hypothetical protein